MLRAFTFVLLLGITAALTRPPASASRGDFRLVLPRADLLRIFGRSHQQLVADFYWLRAINRANTVASALEGEALLGLGNLIADLDPHLNQAYWTIALNAPVQPERPGDVWPNARRAAELLERGIASFPFDNRLYMILVLNLTTYQRDFVRAARALQRRALLLGALPWFAPLAARLLAASGAFEASRQFALVMLQSATDDETRELFRERLKLIALEEQLVKVEAAARNYRNETGNEAPDVTMLISAGYLTEQPVDPFGGAIILNNGRASSTAIKRLEFHTKD